MYITLSDRLSSLDDVIQQFVTSRPRISPTVFHVASREPFSTLVKSSNQMVDNVLDKIAHLPNHIVEWRKETDAYLAGLIPKYRQRDSPCPFLELAATFFRCFRCTEPISYPRILVHSCFLLPSGAKGVAGTKTQKKGRKPKDGLRQPRSLKVINADVVFPSLANAFGEGMHPKRSGVSYYQEASKSARQIILACGENPVTITNTEMDQKDFRVECMLCSSTRRGRLVMRWTTAVRRDSHSIFYSKCTVTFIQLDPSRPRKTRKRDSGAVATG